MTYYEAAIEVLRAANAPLTVQEITVQAIEKDLIRPSGQTPVATMTPVLYLRLMRCHVAFNVTIVEPLCGRSAGLFRRMWGCGRAPGGRTLNQRI